ncbi:MULTISPECIES: formyltransferase family protein [unclassified Arenibacter]|jgi:phosphoribosylglycinamide formyltransferase-1|uniref:formyltransferase family protein n=1 Tax=unclassified Arenibacter TaxID=2615047 RepID=UPI000E355A91|nr:MULTISPECIES: formyltransferase family protein [unclassified Arenibacter]MCM4164771.1 phosphoribosylglycinamide formyltransferase [Arenibacter sp. A80]RFT55839.1 phosphoribosylglycinamide formyltransferase [Arenibacter sp. P308M17]
MNTAETLNWAIMVSRWGRNAKDVIMAYSQGALKRSNIKLLIYEAEPCGAADAAKLAGIDTVRILRGDYENREAYQRRILDELNYYKIDYVLLLSFKYVIKQELLNAFEHRIINIHPSLFPSFLGTHTAIQEALDYGVRISGLTTHIIDEEVDRGTILCQEPIKIKESDTFESIYPKFGKKGKKIVLDTIALIEKKHFKINHQ